MNELCMKEITDNKDESWMINIDGYFVNTIKSYLSSSGISNENIHNIVGNAAKVLNYCPNPESNYESKKTGIVIGKVQSGKTSNFITISALSFDNGYNLNIILGGTKENLLEQNKNRIKECYEKADEDVIILDTKNDINLINEREILGFIERGKKIVIVSLKHNKHIDSITNKLLKSPEISSMPILIIDDEGDEYSLNTKVKKHQESSIYSSIRKMKESCKKHCYISVTATPQANLIISAIDLLSPDFGILVNPGDGYCGLDVFHDVDSPYCIELPENEESLLEDNNVPESFYLALATFYVGAAISSLRHGKKQKFSMLINPCVKIVDLTDVYNKVNLIIERWKSMAKDKDDIGFDNLKKYLEKGFNLYPKETTCCSFDELLDDILETFKSTKLHLIHGRRPLNDADKYYDYNIYLGGQMMGRGITIKGLAITYIIRNSKGLSNVDTVQQRARWFGYRKDIDLCRVFAPRKVLSQYKEIKVHEDDLWQTIIDNQAEGKEFKKMRRIFAIGNNLRLTRTSVARTNSYTFSSWTTEDRFLYDTDKIENNKQFINNFKNKYIESLETKHYGKEKGSPNVFLRNIELKTFLDEVYSKCYFPDNARLDFSYVNKIYKVLCYKNINPIVDIVWIRDDENKPSVHTVDEDGKIPNYMVGRRPKDAEGKDLVYPGDREIHRGSVIEIQIHNIQDRKTKIISTTFALYLPSNYIDKIQLVEPEGWKSL